MTWRFNVSLFLLAVQNVGLVNHEYIVLDMGLRQMCAQQLPARCDVWELQLLCISLHLSVNKKINSEWGATGQQY